MKITWYGTASILLETENSSILFDPFLKFLPKDYEPKFMLENRLSAFKKQQNIFITHGHFDHLASIKEIYNSLPCSIYLTKAPFNTLAKQKFDTSKLKLIEMNDCVNVGDFSVTALHGKHVKFTNGQVAKSTFEGMFSSLKRKLEIVKNYLKYPEKSQTVFYEIKCQNKLIQIMGSADLQKGVNYTVGADLLILPHQGRSDIDEHNKKIVERLKPKRVLLDHYDDAFPPYSKNIPTENFCLSLSKTIPTSPLIEGETIEI